MTTRSIPLALTLSVLVAMSALGQTASELLQKGIYAQETEGNLDSAILIYRQIVNSAPTQREIAATAQYRLAQTLLQKGDMATASTEFAKLARDYSDYRNLVSSLAAQVQPASGGHGPLTDTQRNPAVERLARLTALQARINQIKAGEAGAGDERMLQTLEAQAQDLRKAIAAGGPAGPGGPGGPNAALADFASMSFDQGSPITVRGKTNQLAMANPQGFIIVNDGSTQYIFATAAANQMLKQGFTRNTLQPGEEIVVTGVLASGGQTIQNATAGSATTISKADGTIVFNRASLTQ